MKVLIINKVEELINKKILAFILILVMFIITGCGDKPDQEPMLENVKVNLGNISADKYEVSIGAFRNFIETTGYVTTADSLKWSGFFDPFTKKWMVADNANWEKPDGRQRMDHNYPVTQVSFYDACAYCDWKGGRIPSAEEWDFIAGDSVIMGNIWEGMFPYVDEGNDGYEISVAPRGQFDPNTTGLFDIFGNVWEWTTTFDSLKNARIIKGGSFLCDYNVCAGYIPERYQTTPDDSGLNHLGFRCVYDSK